MPCCWKSKTQAVNVPESDCVDGELTEKVSDCWRARRQRKPENKAVLRTGLQGQKRKSRGWTVRINLRRTSAHCRRADIRGGSMGVVALRACRVSRERTFRDSELRRVAGDSIRKLCGTSSSDAHSSCMQLRLRTLSRSTPGSMLPREKRHAGVEVANETFELEMGAACVSRSISSRPARSVSCLSSPRMGWLAAEPRALVRGVNHVGKRAERGRCVDGLRNRARQTIRKTTTIWWRARRGRRGHRTWQRWCRSFLKGLKL